MVGKYQPCRSCVLKIPPKKKRSCVLAHNIGDHTFFFFWRIRGFAIYFFLLYWSLFDFNYFHQLVCNIRLPSLQALSSFKIMLWYVSIYSAQFEQYVKTSVLLICDWLMVMQLITASGPKRSCKWTVHDRDVLFQGTCSSRSWHCVSIICSLQLPLIFCTNPYGFS